LFAAAIEDDEFVKYRIIGARKLAPQAAVPRNRHGQKLGFGVVW
jgi:hypothetical protein